MCGPVDTNLTDMDLDKLFAEADRLAQPAIERYDKGAAQSRVLARRKFIPGSRPSSDDPTALADPSIVDTIVNTMPPPSET